jgi:homopolymeric O-antigen transport system permease protein
MEAILAGAGQRGRHLAELIRYRELLYMLTYRDVRIRYKQSVMGFFWALLMPCMIVLAGVIVRYGFSLVSNTTLHVTDLAAVAVRSLPWAFTVSALRFATNSLALNEELVTKIYFPKEVIPLSAVAASAFDVAIASCALTLMLVLVGTPLTWNLLWVPVLVLTLLTLVIGAGFVFSAAGLFFRDVKFIVEIMLTFGIFFTPVFYRADLFGPKGVYFMFNPLAPIIESLDSVIIKGLAPDLFWLSYSMAFAILLCVGGYAFFKRLEPMFAEMI